MNRNNTAYSVFGICVIVLLQITQTPLSEEVCLPPLTIAIAEPITDIPHLSLPDKDAIARIIHKAQFDDTISPIVTNGTSEPNIESITEGEETNNATTSEIATSDNTSGIHHFLMNAPVQLQQRMVEHLSEFSMSYQSYLDEHHSLSSSNPVAVVPTTVATNDELSSVSQPRVDAELSKSISHSTSTHDSSQPTQNKSIAIQPQITRLLVSLSPMQQNSVLTIEILIKLTYIDNYSRSNQPETTHSLGYSQRRIVLTHDSIEQDLIEQINNTMNATLIASINNAIERARQSILPEYSHHLATDRAFTFISIGSSNGITVGTRLQIVSTDSAEGDICNSDNFFGLLQVAERYDDYLVAHTRGEFSVPPNTLLVTQAETVAIQPFTYVLIPAIQFQGYSNTQQIAFGGGIRLYPRIGIDRLQPFFALTVDSVIENEGLLLPLHGWVGLGINWYSGRVTISPRLSGGIGIGPYIGNTETVSGIFASGIATVVGSLLLSASLELGIELGYQFGIPLSNTTTIFSQSLQTGYGGIFVGGTLTFYE